MAGLARSSCRGSVWCTARQLTIPRCTRTSSSWITWSAMCRDRLLHFIRERRDSVSEYSAKHKFSRLGKQMERCGQPQFSDRDQRRQQHSAATQLDRGYVFGKIPGLRRYGYYGWRQNIGRLKTRHRPQAGGLLVWSQCGNFQPTAQPTECDVLCDVRAFCQSPRSCKLTAASRMPPSATFALLSHAGLPEAFL
jgi:hypothetical protein